MTFQHTTVKTELVDEVMCLLTHNLNI